MTRAISAKAYNAVSEIEGKAYQEQFKIELNKIYADVQHYQPTTQVLYPLGIMDAYKGFEKAFDAGSMTAQQVYDATMQVIAEKTTVRAPSEPTPAPYVATAEDKAQAASDKKAAAIRAQQDAIQHAKNVKAAKAFRNGDD